MKNIRKLNCFSKTTYLIFIIYTITKKSRVCTVLFICRPVIRMTDAQQMVLTVIFSLCHNLANLYEYIQVMVKEACINIYATYN